MSTQEPITPDRRALLREALRAVDEMQAKLDAAERRRNEPIAIVGIGCRFPGGVTGPEDYWRLLHDGVDAVSEVPAERWDREAYRRFERGGTGLPTFHGGFLDGIDRFDPHVFGISPREAASMDPQQRLVLEVSWEALERAGQAPDRLAGTATGVFIGITTTDYAEVTRAADPDEPRRLLRDRQCAQRRRGPPVVSARPARAEPRRRHRVLVVADGGAPRVSEPAARREQPRAGRRRQRAAGARSLRDLFTVGDDGARRAVQDVRCARRWLRARRRAAGSSCSSGCPTRTRPAIACSPSSAAPRSTRTGPAAGSPCPTVPPSRPSSARRWPPPASPPPTSTTSRPTAPAPRSAIRSSWKPSTRC